MNNKYDLENHEFIQEVNENELNFDPSYKNKAKTFIIILIFLVIFSLLIIIFGFYFYITGSDKKVEEHKSGIEDLFVVHSKPEFGDVVKSFSGYDNKNNSYSYTFYVENNNSDDINYYVYFEDVDFGIASNLCDKNKLNYELVKNGDVVNSGLMKNEKDVKLFKTLINSKGKDNYVLKLWSENDCNGYIKYKINISD